MVRDYIVMIVLFSRVDSIARRNDRCDHCEYSWAWRRTALNPKHRPCNRISCTAGVPASAKATFITQQLDQPELRRRPALKKSKLL
jgi:hypothetical protein